VWTAEVYSFVYMVIRRRERGRMSGVCERMSRVPLEYLLRV
jgi:hypothetical protein